MTPVHEEHAPVPSGFGAELRRLRLLANLTQEGLAGKSGVSPRTISELERGARRTPQFSSAEMLADALELRAEERSSFFDLVRGERLLPGERAGTSAVVPAPGLPILGRETELSELRRLFDIGQRLVTLVGSGGIGKTRLALEFAAAQQPRSVIWTPCDSLSAAAEVMPAALRAAGITERTDQLPSARLAQVLRGRRTLLVLDNLEHLIDVAGEVADLLDAAPELRILATSREPLRLKVETVLPLAPLAPPGGPSLEALRASPAVELFSRSTPQGFLPDQELLEAGHIVSLLDGLPLAIELAAAQTRTLSVGMIGDLLDRVGLPALGSWRDGAQRFRTMDAAVRWSIDLLPPETRQLMRALSVFRGGCDLDAVVDLVDQLGSPALVAELPRLLGSSILRETPGLGGEARLSMLEPVRMVAFADLVAAGEERAVRGAHLAVMENLAARASRSQLSRDAAAALRSFSAERANLMAALDHALATGNARSAITLGNALGFWWEQIGEVRTANGQLPRIIAIDDASSPTRDRWLIRWLAALLAQEAGDYETLRRLAAEVLDIASDAGDREGQALAGIAQALWLQSAEETIGPALDQLDRAIALVEGSDYWLAEGYACSLRAAFRFYGTGETDRPLPDFRRALAIFDAHAPQLSEIPLLNMSAALQAAGRGDEALTTVRSALALNETFMNPLVEALGAWRLALLMSEDASAADAARAARMLGVVDGLMDRYGYVSDQLMRDQTGAARARLARLLGDGCDAAVAEGRDLVEPTGAGPRILEIAGIA